MATELERLARLESQMEELRRLIEQERGRAAYWIPQVIQLLMIAALWFKK